MGGNHATFSCSKQVRPVCAFFDGCLDRCRFSGARACDDLKGWLGNRVEGLHPYLKMRRSRTHSCVLISVTPAIQNVQCLYAGIRMDNRMQNKIALTIAEAVDTGPWPFSALRGN